MKIYLIGSLKDPHFPEVAEALREVGYEVFDDWRGGGHDADLHWRQYELNERDRGYIEAVRAPFAKNSRAFDVGNLDKQDVAVAVCKPNKLPGVSAVAELAYAKLYLGIPSLVLLNGEPDDWELMLPLAVTKFHNTLAELLEGLK